MAPFGMATEQVVVALSIEGATKIPARRAKDARATAGIQTFFGMRRKRKDAKGEPWRTLLIVADKACSRQSPSLISAMLDRFFYKRGRLKPVTGASRGDRQPRKWCARRCARTLFGVLAQIRRNERFPGAIWQRAPPQKILPPAGMAVRPSSRGCSGGRTLAQASLQPRASSSCPRPRRRRGLAPRRKARQNPAVRRLRASCAAVRVVHR